MINQRTTTNWSTLQAVLTIEVFSASDTHSLEAWAHLIDSGMVWELQGTYGRTAIQLIRNGIIDEDGQIDWDKFDSLPESDE